MLGFDDSIHSLDLLTEDDHWLRALDLNQPATGGVGPPPAQHRPAYAPAPSPPVPILQRGNLGGGDPYNSMDSQQTLLDSGDGSVELPLGGGHWNSRQARYAYGAGSSAASYGAPLPPPAPYGGSLPPSLAPFRHHQAPAQQQLSLLDMDDLVAGPAGRSGGYLADYEFGGGVPAYASGPPSRPFHPHYLRGPPPSLPPQPHRYRPYQHQQEACPGWQPPPPPHAHYHPDYALRARFGQGPPRMEERQWGGPQQMAAHGMEGATEDSDATTHPAGSPGRRSSPASPDPSSMGQAAHRPSPCSATPLRRVASARSHARMVGSRSPPPPVRVAAPKPRARAAPAAGTAAAQAVDATAGGATANAAAAGGGGGMQRPRRAAALRSLTAGGYSAAQDDEDDDSASDGSLSPAYYHRLSGAHAGGTKKKHNAWTQGETEALIEGVRLVGPGKWAEIKKLPLPSVSGVLAARSAVDLKDKWRNLSRVARLPKSALKNRLNKGGSETPLELVLAVKELLQSSGAAASGGASSSGGRLESREWR